MRKPPIYTSLIAALIAAAFPSAAYALNYDPAVTINGVAYAENMIVAPKATSDGRYQLDLVGSFAQTPNWMGNFAWAVGNTCAATPVYTPQGNIFLTNFTYLEPQDLLPSDTSRCARTYALGTVSGSSAIRWSQIPQDCLPSDCKTKGTVYITAAEAAQGFTVSLMGWSGVVANGLVTRHKEYYCTDGAEPTSSAAPSTTPTCNAAPIMAVRDKANTTVDSFIVTTNSAGKANTYSFSGVGGVINSASVYTPKSSGTLKTRSLSVDLTVDGQRYSSAGFLYVAAYYNGTLYVLTDKGWTTWDGVSAITAYQSVTLGKHTVSIANGSINLRGLDGLDVYVGYGRDAADMLSNKLYSKVHTLVTTAEDTAEIKAEQDLQIKYAALVEQYNREGLAFTFSYVTSSGSTAQCTASAAQSLQFGKFALANGYLVWQSPASCLFKSPYTVAYDESTKTWRVVQ